jgi:serine-protein kinase ATM
MSGLLTPISDLIFLLDKKGRTENLYVSSSADTNCSNFAHSSRLADKHYHRIFDALFKCALNEKQIYFGGKKSSVPAAASRLSKCAEALRHTVNHGAAKLKRKTVLALIDHVTETLPGPDDDLVQPLVKDYVKALVAALAYQANAEQIATLAGEGWERCVDFCCQTVVHHLGGVERDSGPGSRASPAPGTVSTASLAFSGRSGSGPMQKLGGSMSLNTLQDLLQCLQNLVTPPNAPVLRRAKEISAAVVQVLQVRHLKIGPIHQYAFAIVYSVLTATDADDLTLAANLTKDLVPLVGHWWQGRSVARDASLTKIRDEMLKTIFAVHLHLEHLCLIGSDEFLRKDIDDLIDVLWLEYSRRDERAQLQLDDLTFAGSSLPPNSFRIDAFALRPHNPEAERQWALVQSLALLETIVSRSIQRERPSSAGDQAQPRKRRRMAVDVIRIRQKLKSLDPGVQRTALQLVPFLMHNRVFSVTEISDVLGDLVVLAGDKQNLTASWAMLACAR